MHRPPRAWACAPLRLESRLAPAALMTYTDVDGDLVNVSTSKGSAAALAVALTFNDPNPQHARQLQLVNFAGNPGAFGGTDLIVSARRGPTGGDGRANVGAIDATNLNLGAVVIDGDLVQIDAGTGAATAVRSLAVQSMGVFGTSTELGTNLVSGINGGVSRVSIKGDFRGVALTLTNGGSLGPVTIGGSFRGGATVGGITTDAGNIGQVTIGGDLVGSGLSFMGLTFSTGVIQSGGKLAGLTVGGSVIGSDFDLPMFTGQIDSAGEMGSVSIGGDLVGGGGQDSGQIQTGIDASIARVRIGGSIVAGGGVHSGQINSRRNIGLVTVRGDVGEGHGIAAGPEGGQIDATAGRIARVVIGGSLVGGSAVLVGVVHAAELGSITVDGDVRGGPLDGGSINGDIGLVRIGGSLIDGNILASGGLRSATIGGSVRGGAGLESGAISANGNIGTLTIGGSLVSGSGNLSGSIRSERSIGSVTVRGSVLGTSAHPATIFARGPAQPAGPADIAIGSLHIGGRAEFADIRAGYNSLGAAVNADAQIGSVTVGDWVASSLSAGVDPGADGKFGTADDAKITGGTDTPGVVSRIGSVVIRGQALGTVGGTDHFGFVAQQVGSLSVAGTVIPLQSGPVNDLNGLAVGATSDVTVREIGS
ncbi:MAG TPA: hypothetical protein VKE40_22145 [Gemmataceae bacterium]|nr:hypothetical protein [Gemmataceae bacterium]